jgi:putative membrane protein
VNDDPQVREHLANERTYLAWIRTGIATMGFGVVIAKLRWLFPPDALTPPAPGILRASHIGLVFTVFGLLTVVLAIHRFLVTRNQIRSGRFVSSGMVLVVYAAVIVAMGVLIVWYLLESSRSLP